MQLKFIVLLVGGLILSTNLIAAEPNAHSKSTVVDKNSKDNQTIKQLQLRHQQHNIIYDDYSSGGISPYEPHETGKGK